MTEYASPPNILVADDDDVTALFIQQELEDQGFVVHRACDGVEASECLAHTNYSIVLLDIIMPRKSGIELLQQVKPSINSDTPSFIMISAGDESSIEQCLQLGAYDYIAKPIRSRELNARISSALRYRAAILELRQANNALTKIAHLDSLTGVMNRGRFMDVAEWEVKKFHRYQEPLSFILIDIDHFKEVNDKHGHLVGDWVIKGLTDLCQSIIREADFIGRYGGEEFIICLPRSRIEDAFHVAERLRQMCSEQEFKAPGSVLKCTISAGVTCATPKDSTLVNIINRADKFLYQSKRSGRNRCTMDLDPTVVAGGVGD